MIDVRDDGNIPYVLLLFHSF